MPQRPAPLRADYWHPTGARDERDLALIDQLLRTMTEYPVDRQVAEHAGRRAETGIRLPDAVLAATALVHGLTVHTPQRP